VAFSIRQAVPGDADGIAALYVEVAAEAVAREPSHFSVPDQRAVADRFARLLSAEGDETVLVADVDGDVAGFVQVRLLPRLEAAMTGGRLLAFTEELAVTTDLRGRGIGSSLMAAAESWAGARGAEGMVLDTGVKNERARRFYEERLGYG